MSRHFFFLLSFPFIIQTRQELGKRERKRERKKTRKNRSSLSASICIRSIDVEKRWTTIATILCSISFGCLLCRLESRIGKKDLRQQVSSFFLVTLVYKLLWTFSVFPFHKHHDDEKFRHGNNFDRKISKCCRSFTNALTNYNIFYS